MAGAIYGNMPKCTQSITIKQNTKKKKIYHKIVICFFFIHNYLCRLPFGFSVPLKLCAKHMKIILKNARECD